MLKLVECVPNFSEGQNSGLITQITEAISSGGLVQILDVDPGKDTNRTVVTFVGEPEAVLEASFLGIQKASEVIDMSGHTGAHARMGATDVCPFVPVSGVSMKECAELAGRLGERVGKELGIPVYLYEEAATAPERINLANIRAGEYEGLAEKLKDPAWKPDFGPARFNKKAGATAIGAREFLIAYNINLNTRNVKIAKEIAFSIREKGRLKRDKSGQIVLDSNGEKQRVPGKFSHCKAVGWYMNDFGRAQISINLTNYKKTPPHLVFDACCDLAETLGVRVTGSELVGLIPLEAMRQAGMHFLKKQGQTVGVPESELIHTAALSLGLNDLYPFDPSKKIIEYLVAHKPPLVSMPVNEFVNRVSDDSPTPGGGSVAALCGALSASLSSMVAALTHGKKGFESQAELLEQTGTHAQTLLNAFITDVDRDTDAFNAVIQAIRLPAKTESGKLKQKAALEDATKEAARVPMQVLERCLTAVELASQIAENSNPSSVSDAGVAALCARAAAEGAYLNVCINLQNLNDKEFKTHFLQKAENVRQEVVTVSERIIRMIEKKILN